MVWTRSGPLGTYNWLAIELKVLMRPVPTNCIAAIAATAINAAMSAYSMAVTPDPSLISFKKSARNRVILGLIRTHAQIADQTLRSS